MSIDIFPALSKLYELVWPKDPKPEAIKLRYNKELSYAKEIRKENRYVLCVNNPNDFLKLHPKFYPFLNQWLIMMSHNGRRGMHKRHQRQKK